MDPKTTMHELDRKRHELEDDGCPECGREVIDVRYHPDDGIPHTFIDTQLEYPWTSWRCTKRRCVMRKDWNSIAIASSIAA